MILLHVCTPVLVALTFAFASVVFNPFIPPTVLPMIMHEANSRLLIIIISSSTFIQCKIGHCSKCAQLCIVYVKYQDFDITFIRERGAGRQLMKRLVIDLVGVVSWSC